MTNKLTRVTKESECYYSINIGSITNCGCEGLCDACRPHSREKTCIGFPQNAAGAQYQNLLILSPAGENSLLVLIITVPFRCGRGPCWFLQKRSLVQLLTSSTGLATWVYPCSCTTCSRRRILTKPGAYEVPRQSAQACPTQTLQRKAPRRRIGATLRQLEASDTGFNGSRGEH